MKLYVHESYLVTLFCYTEWASNMISKIIMVIIVFSISNQTKPYHTITKEAYMTQQKCSEPHFAVAELLLASVSYYSLWNTIYASMR